MLALGWGGDVLGGELVGFEAPAFAVGLDAAGDSSPLPGRDDSAGMAEQFEEMLRPLLEGLVAEVLGALGDAFP